MMRTKLDFETERADFEGTKRRRLMSYWQYRKPAKIQMFGCDFDVGDVEAVEVR